MLTMSSRTTYTRSSAGTIRGLECPFRNAVLFSSMKYKGVFHPRSKAYATIDLSHKRGIGLGIDP